MNDEVIQHMRDRASQCRRLSDLTHDREMAEQLRKWAEQIEADIKKLEADRR
jgi:hypothetical protein